MSFWDRDHRRYREYFLTRGARGGIGQQTPTHFGTIALFNNSDQMLLIVRNYWWTANSTGPWGMGQTNSRLTGTPCTINPMYPLSPAPPGLVDYSDQATALTTDVATANTLALQLLTWPNDIPFALIPPGWSIYLTNLVAAKNTAGGFFWDWCFPDEVS